MRKIFFVMVLMFLSCNSKVEESVNNERKPINITDNQRIEFEIDFPDTVFLNEENYGMVSYKSHLDSIIKNFGVRDTNRYVRLITTVKEDVDYDLGYLKTIVKDTFGATDNREIFFMLKFDKKGTTYIDGVINDLIQIDMHKKGENGGDIVRLIEDEVRVTKKVVVIDK